MPNGIPQQRAKTYNPRQTDVANEISLELSQGWQVEIVTSISAELVLVIYIR